MTPKVRQRWNFVPPPGDSLGRELSYVSKFEAVNAEAHSAYVKFIGVDLKKYECVHFLEAAPVISLMDKIAMVLRAGLYDIEPGRNYTDEVIDVIQEFETFKKEIGE